VSAPAGLERKSITGLGLWALAVVASAPLTVIGGGVVNTYATTGVVGVPLAFLLVAVALGLLTVGYAALARRVPNAASFYAGLAQGLGRPVGVAGAMVALLGYNAIQIGLYGLFGVFTAGLTQSGEWWQWALLGWMLVTVFGLLHVNVNAGYAVTTLILEIGVLLLFDIGAFTHPAGGAVTVGPMSPDRLFVGGIGGVLAFTIAAYVGYETTAVYGEEAKVARGVLPVLRPFLARLDPKRLSGWAAFAALLACGLLYTVSAWALVLAAGTGPDQVKSITVETIFSVLQQRAPMGLLVAYLARLLLVSSVFGATLSFHNAVSRYVFALARERVLPPKLAATRRRGTPKGGSLQQSLLALAAIWLAQYFHVDPIAGLFTWLSTVGAVAVLLLLTLSSFAAIGYFVRHRRSGAGRENLWTRVFGPLLGVGCGCGVLYTIVSNLASLLGVSSFGKTLIVPGLVAGAFVVGLWLALLLRLARPTVYSGIGRGLPDPLRQLDPALAEMPV
jgi:amino acid transporter